MTDTPTPQRRRRPFSKLARLAAEAARLAAEERIDVIAACGDEPTIPCRVEFTDLDAAPDTPHMPLWLLDMHDTHDAD